MIHKSSKRKYKSRKKMGSMAVRDAENIVYDMVIKADQRGKLVSRKEIEEKLSEEPEYQLSKGAISGVLKNMRLKHMITIQKKIKKQHYYGLPVFTTPYYLASIFFTIIIVGVVIFLLSYNWGLSNQTYYLDVNTGFYVNHHYLTIAFVVVMIANNIIFAICWNKFGTRKLKKRTIKTK
jgi:hypothetical protein